MTKEEFIEYIRYLYVEKDLTYPQIRTELAKTYSTRYDLMEIIIKVLEQIDIKRCSRRTECKHPKGPILSRSEFNSTGEKKGDGLRSNCRICSYYNTNYKSYDKKDKRKRDLLVEYFKLTNDEDRENFIIKVYTEDFYSFMEISGITIRPIEEIVQIIHSRNIKVCNRKENCVNKNGCVQKLNNFRKDSSTIDGLKQTCNSCVNKRMQGKHYTEYRKRRKTISQQYCKEYNTRPAKYKTYQKLLGQFHKIRKDPNDETLIQIKCKMCKKWFNPTNLMVRARAHVLRGLSDNIGTEANFYCSESCKKSCGVFNSRSINIREGRMQGELRRYILEIIDQPDTCKICGRKFDVKDLILHHVHPVASDYISEADLDNLIWVCEDCHTKVHDKAGCSFVELRELSNC